MLLAVFIKKLFHKTSDYSNTVNTHRTFQTRMNNVKQQSCPFATNITAYISFLSHIKYILRKVTQCCVALPPFRENPTFICGSISQHVETLANHQSFLPQIYRIFNIYLPLLGHSPNISPPNSLNS